VRLPEEKIKEAILHPDLEIRGRATSYFSRSYSPDPSLMPQVIKAVETYGKQDAYHLIGSSRDMQQTEDTIAWVIGELNDPQADQYENYTYNLSMVLVNAEPALLLPRETAIVEARHFYPALREPFTERLQMLSWDMTTCWQRLEEFCEKEKDKQYVNEVNLGYAGRIVEALARYGKECEEKVHAILTQRVEDFRNHPMAWLEPLTVKLAGEAHLESTIPLIVAKLHEEGDLLGQECLQALTKIGTPEVLHAIAKAYPTAPAHFRIYASGPLEYIHTDLAVETCLLLLPQEKDRGLKINLAHSLLSHFPYEGIEPVRQLLVGQELDFEGRGLRNYLLETCTIMGERIPEHDEWLATEKAEKEEHRRRVKELEGDPNGLLLFALENLAGKKAPETKAKSPRPAAPRLQFPRKVPEKANVGRNAPCPCGSSKKYKNCCMRKGR
jgi:hypothetical protein